MEAFLLLKEEGLRLLSARLLRQPCIIAYREMLGSMMCWVSARAKSEIFVWGGQVATLIYLSRQLLTHTYIHMLFFYYIHTFLFDKLYIYTHPTNKKSLVLSIKILFDSDLS